MLVYLERYAWISHLELHWEIISLHHHMPSPIPARHHNSHVLMKCVMIEPIYLRAWPRASLIIETQNIWTKIFELSHKCTRYPILLNPENMKRSLSNGHTIEYKNKRCRALQVHNNIPELSFTLMDMLFHYFSFTYNHNSGSLP